MAAYGAAASLKNTIHRILHSPRISLAPPSSQIAFSAHDLRMAAYDAVTFLKNAISADNLCMAAYGAAVSLKNTIRRVYQRFDDFFDDSPLLVVANDEDYFSMEPCGVSAAYPHMRRIHRFLRLFFILLACAFSADYLCMAAYGAVASLKNMIQHIQQSSFIISLASPYPQIVFSADDLGMALISRMNTILGILLLFCISSISRSPYILVSADLWVVEAYGGANFLLTIILAILLLFCIFLAPSQFSAVFLRVVPCLAIGFLLGLSFGVLWARIVDLVPVDNFWKEAYGAATYCLKNEIQPIVLLFCNSLVSRSPQILFSADNLSVAPYAAAIFIVNTMMGILLLFLISRVPPSPQIVFSADGDLGMAPYGLKNTIKGILLLACISLVSRSPQILFKADDLCKAAYGAATSLKNTVLRILLLFCISLVVSFSAGGLGIAAYGAAISLMNMIRGILLLFCISLISRNPEIINSADDLCKAAYGATTFLKNMIQRILQWFCVLLTSPSPQILKPAYDEMDRLQRVLVKLDDTSCSKIKMKVNALDERIKEAIWEFEDLIESHVFPQILQQLESRSCVERDNLSFSVDLQSLQHHVDRFVKKMKMMEEEYTNEMENMAEEDGEPISSRIDFGGINSKMVGLSYVFQSARDELLEHENISIIGMAGVGKTTLAKHIFEDPSIQSHFEFRAWVKVGRKCESNELLRCILAQVDPIYAYQMLIQVDDDDEEVVGLLKDKLKDKKCLIVLDDIWEIREANRLTHCLQENNISGRIGYLLTSRQDITFQVQYYSIYYSSIRVPLLNEEESKELLGEKVFGEEGFPIQLEELGKMIAGKCEGLPLMIVTVAELLSKAEKTPEYWTEVAYKQHHSLFEDAYNQISEILFPSYDYLLQHLKMFFLYMGAFAPYHDICPSILNKLLSSEGFLELIREEESYENFLKKLMWYNLVSIRSNSLSKLRKYHMHSCWQHLCKEEASRIKFLHVLQSCDDVISDQRRLCVHWNSLFCFKEVCDSIKSDCASTVRSLLCHGPYHPYPIQINAMDFKLLRVLHALHVRFYHIPIEILKLVCLRYLSLTCNGDLPPSISNLFHLQFLIIDRHMSIKKRGVQSYMPEQIWEMQELECIDVRGRDLPTPNTDDATLNKLVTLWGVSANSCTREVLKRIPNLRQLGIEVQLKPYNDDETNPMSCLSYISQLQNLQTLAYWVWNPDIKYEFNTIHLSMFPSSLTFLQLGGLGYPWEYMNYIGSLLPNLLTLSLKSYAFRGSEWEIYPGSFLKLTELQIEDTDLVRWRPHFASFIVLRRLTMRHCYKLQQLDWINDHGITIELVECNPLAVTCAKELEDKLFLYQLIVKSSF